MRSLASIVLALAALAPVEDPETITRAASFEVYVAVLGLDSHAHAVAKVFLRNETRVDRDCLSAADAVPSEWRFALADYIRSNHTSIEFDGREVGGLPFHMIASSYFDEIVTKPDQWELWWTETPGWFGISIGPDDQVLFEVSSVGFDKSRQHSIVYLGRHGAGESGEGTVWLLERSSAGWVPFTTFEQCKWVS